MSSKISKKEYKVNLEVRSEVLEYSLILEEVVNRIILLNLGIMDDGKKTRLFGKRAGLTFKNKIDLLYDIEVLNKDENSELELLMVFRNKFLHDIDCNYYIDVYSNIDKSIQRKFKKFLENDSGISVEESCKRACLKLFRKNLETLQNKFKRLEEKIELKNELFQLSNKQTIFYLDLFFDALDGILKHLEQVNVTDITVAKLMNQISELCGSFSKKPENDKDLIAMQERWQQILMSPQVLNDYFGIIKVNDSFILKKEELAEKFKIIDNS